MVPAPKKIKEDKKEVVNSEVVPEITQDADVDVAFPELDDKPTPDGKERYYESIGRRKESIARVRLFTRKSTDAQPSEHALITVNDKEYGDYFKDVFLLSLIEEPLKRLKSLNRFKVTIKVNGGGIAGQAQAVAHGISRALELFDANFRKKLKKSGLLKRDPRSKERRKYGLKKARKAPQWRKR
jgi:small subunit ribosomal protein S9